AEPGAAGCGVDSGDEAGAEAAGRGAPDSAEGVTAASAVGGATLRWGWGARPREAGTRETWRWRLGAAGPAGGACCDEGGWVTAGLDKLCSSSRPPTVETAPTATIAAV